MFSCKNHVGIATASMAGFLRCDTMTDAAAHDGGLLGAVLNRETNIPGNFA
jgi:predicted TIM-barrel enzyme